jgi:tetratricopeptide (TPR) repeat protein/serine/threonine protein kinase
MRERDIFIAALSKGDPAERSAYVNGACAGDDGLRRRVELLLQLHASVGNFLEKPAGQGMPIGAPGPYSGPDPSPGPPTAEVDGREPTETPGSAIGPYKLLQLIGEGGMGTVFMAEQTHPVQRKVALKVIKQGLDSRQVVARFEAERQALALMDHPNIAKVLDAGTIGSEPRMSGSGPPQTLTGVRCSEKPFFVMELVKGVPITKYSDEQRLTPRQRLALFVPVCQAVQHAHQKGIIHRDLKPSNVLIARYDGQPVPKVIDFGVAKATGPKLTERTLFTEFGAVVGTLEYMSPEQAELNQLDVDTRSDIYALGVLLYELLTGTTPLERQRLKATGLLEALRLIREEEPPTPSTRLCTTAELPAIAANRGTEPRKLSGLLRGELDWIVMKCLEKERGRRYETASSLARDIERYLADEPVLACPPTTAYRLKKFAKRHKRGLAAAAALAVMLLATVGAVAGSIGWVARDRAARQAALTGQITDAVHEARRLHTGGLLYEAKTTARRAEELLDTGVAGEPLHEQVKQLRKDLAMLERLEQIRLEQAAVEATAFATAAADPAYARAFREYGIDVEALTEDEAVRRLTVSAIRIELAVALDNWAMARPGPGKRAGPDNRGLLAISRRADPDLVRNRLRAAIVQRDGRALSKLAAPERANNLPASSLIHLAQALRRSNRPSQAIALLRQGHQRYPHDFWINHDLGMFLTQTKPPRWDEAIRYYTAAVALRPESAGAHLNLGNALADKGILDEAGAEYRTAVRLAPYFILAYNNLGDNLRKRGALGEAHRALTQAVRFQPGLATAHTNLGIVLHLQGKWAEAAVEFRKAIRLRPASAHAHYSFGLALHQRGLLDEAIVCYRKALAVEQRADAQASLGNALQVKGRTDEAIACYRKALAIDPRGARVHNNLGSILRAKGQLDEAIACFRQAIQLRPDDAVVHNNLGIALQTSGRVKAAIGSYREALRLRPDYALALDNLGNALLQQHKLDEAIACHRRATQVKPGFAEAYNNLGIALRAKGRLEEAVVSFGQLIKLEPNAAWAHNNLGLTLESQGRLNEAVVCFRRAIALKANYARAHNNLGNVLAKQAELDEAITCFHRALQLQPNYAIAHVNLGKALWKKGRHDKAISCFLQATRLQPNYATAQSELGLALEAQGKKDEALACYRAAVRLRPGAAVFHYNLGNMLRTLNKKEEAIACYRKTLAIDPAYAEAHCNLGHALDELGKYPEALAALKRGHGLGSKRFGWSHPSARWVAECARRVELDARLAAVLRGAAKPKDGAEQLEFARHCDEKKLYGAAARLYAEVLAAEPRRMGLFFPAARAAALAGCARGKDAAQRGDPERARWRKQAHAWLRAALEERRKQLERHAPKGREAVRRVLEAWKASPDFVNLRDLAVLSELADAEREAWQKLWVDVETVLRQARKR